MTSEQDGRLRAAIGALRDEVGHLSKAVEGLTARLEPVEAHVSQAAEKEADAAKRAALIAQLREAGVDVPPGFGDDTAPGAPVPRLGWAREAFELAATPGGTRVLVAVAAVLLGPDAVRLGSELLDVWRGPTPIVVSAPAEGDDDDGADPTLPDIHDPAPTGPSTDSPAAPRPNL